MAGAIGHKTHPRPGLSHGQASAPREKVFGPGRLVPLDRNAKVRVMMVPRAQMRHQEKRKGLRQDQREGAGGPHRVALAFPQRRDRQVLPRHTRRSHEPAGCIRSTVYP
jgi:hypothetical protein